MLTHLRSDAAGNRKKAMLPKADRMPNAPNRSGFRDRQAMALNTNNIAKTSLATTAAGRSESQMAANTAERGRVVLAGADPILIPPHNSIGNSAHARRSA